MASWIIWLKNWVAGQVKCISYISAPHQSLLLSFYLNCPSLDCVDSCSAGSLIRHGLPRAFGIATFLCLTFSRFLLFLAQVYTSPISCCIPDTAWSVSTVSHPVPPSDRRFAASITVMSVWIVLMDSVCLCSGERACFYGDGAWGWCSFSLGKTGTMTPQFAVSVFLQALVVEFGWVPLSGLLSWLPSKIACSTLLLHQAPSPHPSIVDGFKCG